MNVGVMAANYPYSPMMYQHQQQALGFTNPHSPYHDLNLMQQHSPQPMEGDHFKIACCLHFVSMHFILN